MEYKWNRRETFDNQGDYCMRFQVELKNLSDAIGIVGRAVATKGVKPILANLFITSIKQKIYSGVINAAIGEPITNKEFTKIMGQLLKRSTFFTVPKFVIRLMMGKEMGEIALRQQKGVTHRFSELGFTPRFSCLQSALKDIFGQHDQPK